MKKIYLMLMSAALISLVACGGEEKKDDKKDKGESEEEAEEPKKEEAKVDYSYVVPQIDTAALTDDVLLIDAMTKVVKARQLDDSLSGAVADYDGYFTELTNLYSAVLQKGTKYSIGLKPKDAIAFNEKFNAVQN